MIRFVDLKTGNVFEGASPYIFWFDGEQGVNIFYSKPICFISDTPDDIQIEMEENDVFSLINTNKITDTDLSTIYGFTYHNLNTLITDDDNKQKTTTMWSVGTPHHNYYVHMIYIVAVAKQSGEYLHEFKINGEIYKVGADFYEADEPLYINLSNNGIEIPEVIQKALYDVNVHEDKRDNITLNRKWKEMLSNYWDMIANKGSYKSLYNSLKWFEYNDLVRLCEIWKMKDGPYFMRDVQTILSDHYIQTLNNFAKTTYFGLYCALEKHKTNRGKIVYDDEKNPELEKVSFKWSIQDLALKICLLGNFYETYFMPIHLDLIHSTIENIIYSNTFKIRLGCNSSRNDIITCCEDINCNVQNGDIFKLDKVQCYVGPETLFGSSYSENNPLVMVGVQKELIRGGLTTNQQIKDYASQLYNNIGAIVDFQIDVPLKTNDKIKREVLVYNTYLNGEPIRKTITNYRLLDNHFQFSLFCPIEGEYSISLQLDSQKGETFTKYVKFEVVDTEHIGLKIYKIQNKLHITKSMLNSRSEINDYIFSRRSINIEDKLQKISQFIPGRILNVDEDWDNKRGVYLSHMLILNNEKNQLNNNYFVLKKKVTVGNSGSDQYYYIYISKTFKKDIDDNTYNAIKSSIYREDYIFIPEFHELVELTDYIRNDYDYCLDDFTITDNDTICVIPELSYGKHIAEYDWIFTNASKPLSEPINLSYIKEPFISLNTKNFLEPGYYNIAFNYRLTNENKINTVTLNSAFKKVKYENIRSESCSRY